MSQLTPAQALENLARIAEAALLNGPDRRVIERSIAILNTLVNPPPAAPPLGCTEEAVARGAPTAPR